MEETLQAVHQIAARAGASHAAHSGSHELPNITTLLSQLWPDSLFFHFIHQWENIFFCTLIALLICLTALYAARQKSIIPKGIQNVWEFIVEAIEGFVSSILGSHGRKHLPFLGTLFLYILLMDWSGLVPLMKSPTSSWSTTIALALCVMVYVQYTGIREQSFFSYLKHMAGNPSNAFGLVLIPLMLAINIVIEWVAVPLSLSLRLFANISSEDMLLFKFAELNVMFKGIPFLLQLFANLLAIAFSFVQAFVFMLLSTVYISQVLPHEDHGAHEETEVAHTPTTTKH